jgi:ABC-type branched-subunit amino acid transport system substrate-binding protein
VKRTGWLALAVVSSMAAAACSSSGSGKGGLGGTTATTTKKDACAGKTLTAPEVGVSATQINITVVADTGNPLKPGLFQGSIDGVKAWAASVNANGGLACRKVNVLTHDSFLTADEAKNGVTTACTTSVALVGTTALSLNDMRPAEGCKDKAGAATGIPDLPVLQTEPAEQCSPISFAVIPNGGSCPYKGTGVRSYQSVTPAVEWFKKNVTTDLHGVFVVPSDLPSTITASTPIFTAITRTGVKMDAEFGASAFFTQSQYTPIIQSIKSHKATWVMNGLDYSGTMAMRKEAAAQGIDSVKVWACSLQCYTTTFLSEGGNAVEGQYSWMQFLPFEDKGSNDALDTFLQYDTKPDSFGLQAFSAGMLFQQVVEAIVAKSGPNAITRSAILNQIRTVHDFDAGGLLVKTDIAGHNPSPCILIMQVKNHAWVRVDPLKPGTFDCDQPSAITKMTIDPEKAYHPVG